MNEAVFRKVIRMMLISEAKKKKKSEVKCPLLPNGKRDYKCEYQKYGGASKKGKKDRAARNKARKQAEREGLVKKGDGMELDHIMPLSLGGSNDPKNWQIITRSENRKKGAKWDGKSGVKNESIRRLVRKLILESSAKGPKDLEPGVDEIHITPDVDSFNVDMYSDGIRIFRMQVTPSTGNGIVYQVGAAYVLGPRAEGFGPMMYDIAMEYTTKVYNKWLTADRTSCSEDAQKVWQYYKDHRQDEPGISVMPLDSRMNVMTPDSYDNVLTQQADETMMGWGSDYWSAEDPDGEYTRNFYRENGMMYAYKKEPDVIPQLLDLEGILTIENWE